MRSQRLRPPPCHTGRRFAATAFVLALAVVSAAVTVNLLFHATHIAVGGPLAVHPSASAPPVDQQSPDDVLPPGAPQPATVSVPVGPHLNVPILYYHYIRTIAPTAQNLLGFRLSIPPGLFAEQMALLHVEGAHTITLSTLMAALAGKTTLPPHAVVLTFDDGYADFATAAEPVLARYGFVATDFVVSGFLGRRSYMTAAQVLAMDAAGMVIGCHTVHHVDLAAVSLAEARTEIDSSKAALEQLLGHPVLDFAYPYGGFNAAVVQLLQQAGFRDAVSTMYGDTQALNGRYLLHRTEIGGAPSLDTFAGDAGLPLPTPSTAPNRLSASMVRIVGS
ncbi:MAG: polysaccharide deacetylase family protein [Candidatus Dormibacteraeota bacterium]|uniref:Polysaccharide deacetylase family protein n=1 Tax=Candidatus Aeolococcus gillhamiae TaxID=3127015 RepID=A0A934JZA5_9BACT|nr:polysaccharide deacetylase family protein [Candidatus Dormibacteraeota bacterium]